eukprot:scaffold1949_cov204-Alexandrium_tamarense.AAC.3
MVHDVTCPAEVVEGCCQNVIFGALITNKLQTERRILIHVHRGRPFTWRSRPTVYHYVLDRPRPTILNMRTHSSLEYTVIKPLCRVDKVKLLRQHADLPEKDTEAKTSASTLFNRDRRSGTSCL